MNKEEKEKLVYELKTKESELKSIPITQFVYNPHIETLLHEIEEIKNKLKEEDNNI